jgi:hypothetical protein
MDYNARYYDAKLARFISADTLVPEPGNPQSLNRYSTRTGAETLCAICSYISTVRKHNLNVIDAIHDALSGNPFIPAILRVLA